MVSATRPPLMIRHNDPTQSLPLSNSKVEFSGPFSKMRVTVSPNIQVRAIYKFDATNVDLVTQILRVDRAILRVIPAKKRDRRKAGVQAFRVRRLRRVRYAHHH